MDEARSADVTVVIPTYNGAKHIDKAINSVLRQSLMPKELIIVDDRSSDDTLAVIDTCLASNTAVHSIRCRVIRQAVNSGGPARPINIGVQSASSRYIAVLEQDDLFEESYIERLVYYVSRPDVAVDFVFTRVAVDNLRDRVSQDKLVDVNRIDPRLLSVSLAADLYVISPTLACEKLIEGNFAITCSCFFFARTAWEKVNGFDENIRTCVDYGFIQKIAMAHDIAFLDAPLVRWRMHDTSFTMTARSFEKSTDLLRVLKRFDKSMLSVSGVRKLQSRQREYNRRAVYLGRKEGERKGAILEYLLESLRSGDLFFGLRELVKLGVSRR